VRSTQRPLAGSANNSLWRAEPEPVSVSGPGLAASVAPSSLHSSQ
jgi:hypothetical protein